MKKPSLTDVKKAVKQVQETKACPVCNAHLEAIKEHRDRGHKL
jgi:ribosomal protein L34E